MPFYEFECKSCGHAYEEIKSIANPDAPSECPNCKSLDTSRLFSPSGMYITVGFGWGDKNRKFGRDRSKKSEEMKKIQRDHYGPSISEQKAAGKKP